MRYTHAHNSQQGSALLLTLFFSALFIVMFGATLSYIMVQHRAVQHEVARIQAVEMADAGTQYYRWHLAHAPDDFVTNTGEMEFTNHQNTSFGNLDIQVTPPDAGSTIATITVDAASVDFPNTVGRVRALYGKPTLAQYAFLTNSNVWFGEGEEISGRIHANGGVRMDGEGDSVLQSAQEVYTCGPEHGCSNEEKPGIWGEGEKPIFWHFPEEAIDFNELVVDLEDIHTHAQSDGIYLPDSDGFGYFVEFFADGTLTIHTVTEVYSPVYGYDGTTWTYESNDKRTWEPVSGYIRVPIPENGAIFLEDDVWVSGDVNGRALVAAARLPEGSGAHADIYIQNDLTYTTHDGESSLGLIAQEDILVPLRSEDTLEIDAALVAVHGHTFRYYYPYDPSEPYQTYAIRDRIETYGALLSNTIWTWSWVSGDNTVTSGYETTETTYDPDLTYAPPPWFPTEDEYTFISWEELELNEE